MLLDEIPGCQNGKVWIFTDLKCTRLHINMVGNYFNFTDVARIYLLVELKYEKNLFVTVVVLEV